MGLDLLARAEESPEEPAALGPNLLAAGRAASALTEEAQGLVVMER